MNHRILWGCHAPSRTHVQTNHHPLRGPGHPNEPMHSQPSCPLGPTHPTLVHPSCRCTPSIEPTHPLGCTHPLGESSRLPKCTPHALADFPSLMERPSLSLNSSSNHPSFDLHRKAPWVESSLGTSHTQGTPTPLYMKMFVSSFIPIILPT
jgi:hypothetical protein